MRTRASRVLGGMTAGLAAVAMTMVIPPLAAAQRAGLGLPQRGAGQQRGLPPPGQRRGGPPPGQRRGGPFESATAHRIQQRTYLFEDTNETIEYAVFVSSRVDRNKPSPLVIGLHGLGSPPAMWLRRLSDAAEEAGYIVAAPMGYDVRGWYGANGPTSGRKSPPNLGELSERDVMNVLELMRKEFKVDDRRIYLAGHSMGGAGALFLGIKHKNVWAAVAASAPAIRTHLHDPSELEHAAEMPMMLIQGDADRAVPVEQTRRWAEKMKALSMTYEYREIRGAGHSDVVVRAARDIFKFFDKHVRPAGPPPASRTSSRQPATNNRS